MSESKVVDRVVDALFDLKKEQVFLLAIIAGGLLIRIIAAINLGVSADDMHHVTHAINFFSADRLVTYDQSSGLWHSFTSIIYALFGASQFTSRFAAVLFGTATIPVLYLLTKRFFTKEIALIAAFLLAVAPFHIKNSIAEMDNMAMFFVMFSMLLFVDGIKSSKKIYPLLSGLCMGAALYTKVYPVLFIPSFALFFFIVKRKESANFFSKENMQKILIFSVVAGLFAIPVLTHNLLLYQDKGFVDLQFTRTFDIGRDISEQYYGWDHQFTAENAWAGLVFGDRETGGGGQPLLWYTFMFIKVASPLLFFLGIIGVALVLFKKVSYTPYLIFFGCMVAVIWPFLASIILLPKHFVFFELLFIPLAACTLSEASRWTKKRVDASLALPLILGIVVVVSLGMLGTANPNALTHVYGKSHVPQVMSYVESDIPQDALIVADSRFYRGRVHWMFYGRPYLEGLEFIELLNQQEAAQGALVPTEVFFVECISQDCGWGRNQIQGPLNDSMQALTASFAEGGTLTASFTEPNRKETYIPLFSGDTSVEAVKIYRAEIPLNPQVVQVAKNPRSWFLYPIGYEPESELFDSYTLDSMFEQALFRLARLIVIFSLLIACVAPLYCLYLVIIER